MRRIILNFIKVPFSFGKISWDDIFIEKEKSQSYLMEYIV